jgi:hypothetical protein
VNDQLKIQKEFARQLEAQVEKLNSDLLVANQQNQTM